jgi:hypothetical protein
MTIAEQKKQTNIVEYVLFMWQMEDMARAAKFEPSIYGGFIGESMVPKRRADEVIWFQDLCQSMKDQDCEIKGHIKEVVDTLAELQQLHVNLLNSIKDKKYQDVFVAVTPSMEEFQRHMDRSDVGDVESLLTGLYGLLVLKLKGQEISDPTQKAMDLFSRVLGLLAAHHRVMKEGESNVNLN